MYEALIAATHARAEELGEGYVWSIAPARSVCEMVRRAPASMEELRSVWGFGGKGLRAQRHGAPLLVGRLARRDTGGLSSEGQL